MDQLIEIIDKFGDTKILCIGDIMLDRYAYGSVSRTAPEGNAPVLLIHEENLMLGGAGNTLSNIARLGAKTYAMGVIGKDATGAAIKHILQDDHVDIEGLVVDESRPSISKSRYVRQNTTDENEHIVRVDYEDTATISAEIEDKFIALAQKLIPNIDVIVISDYRKGIITDKLAKEIIAVAKKEQKPVLIDTKITDYTIYQGATLVKPNKKELGIKTGQDITTEEDIKQAALGLIQKYDLQALLVTRSEEGSTLVTKDGDVSNNTNNVSQVIDVAGAGDSVIATAAVAVAAGATLQQAAELGNIAGNFVVEQLGTTIITQEDLSNRIKQRKAA